MNIDSYKNLLLLKFENNWVGLPSIEFIEKYVYSEGLDILIEIIYKKVEIEEIYKFISYLNHVKYYHSYNPGLWESDLKSAVQLFEYSKIYTNLIDHKIRENYRKYIRKLKEFDSKNHSNLDLTIHILEFENLLRYKNNKCIHPLWEIWELESFEYHNFLQWFPRELVEMNLEFYSGKYQVNPLTYIY